MNPIRCDLRRLNSVCLPVNWQRLCSCRSNLLISRPPPPDLLTRLREVWVEASSRLPVPLYSSLLLCFCQATPTLNNPITSKRFHPLITIFHPHMLFHSEARYITTYYWTFSPVIFRKPRRAVLLNHFHAVHVCVETARKWPRRSLSRACSQPAGPEEQSSGFMDPKTQKLVEALKNCVYAQWATFIGINFIDISML